MKAGLAVLGLLVALCSFSAHAQPGQIDTTVPPPVKEISDGIYDIDGIRVDQHSGTVTVNGKIEMVDGVLEYALVNDQGKVHESLITTPAQPYYLHVALLLMGVREIINAPTSAPPGQITAEYLANAPKLDGDPIHITVSWIQADGTPVEKPLTDLLLEMAKPVAKESWFYNGSMVIRGAFLAQEDRSMIALITDPAALVNNHSPERDKDSAWGVNVKATPPLHTAVQVRFHLPKNTENPE